MYKLHTLVASYYIKQIVYGMAERFVQIPLERHVRETLKRKKGVLTYSQFLQDMFGDVKENNSLTVKCQKQ